MKYKVGDEVLVKAKIINSTRRYFGVEVEDNRFDVCEGYIIPVPEMTAEEAWDIARKIVHDASDGGMSIDDLRNVFGISNYQGVLSNFTPQQAKSKIEAWEAEKEIKVGDFVEYEGVIFCVTSLIREHCCGIDANGYVCSTNKKDAKKTGRHIDIEGILKQIGGGMSDENIKEKN